MANEKTSGRTAWDALVEIPSAWRFLLSILGFIAAVLFFVILSAEPGTTVDIFGLKYQKANAKPLPPSAPAPDESAEYLLPIGKVVAKGQDEAIPILDGTLAVEYRNDGSGKLVGPSISKIQVGSRRLDGRPDQLNRPQQSDAEILFYTGTRMELAYRDRVFAMSTVATGDGTFKISVEKLQRATLDLVPVAKLPVPDTGD